MIRETVNVSWWGQDSWRSVGIDVPMDAPPEKSVDLLLLILSCLFVCFKALYLFIWESGKVGGGPEGAGSRLYTQREQDAGPGPGVPRAWPDPKSRVPCFTVGAARVPPWSDLMLSFPAAKVKRGKQSVHPFSGLAEGCVKQVQLSAGGWRWGFLKGQPALRGAEWVRDGGVRGRGWTPVFLPWPPSLGRLLVCRAPCGTASRNRAGRNVLASANTSSPAPRASGLLAFSEVLTGS